MKKWIMYNNVVTKMSWSQQDDTALVTLKVGLYQKNILLSVWWDRCTCTMSYNWTINSEKYYSQLNFLQAVIKKKQPALANRTNVEFLQDNASARPYVSLKTQQKLQSLGGMFYFSKHILYSPDIAPLDYHLFLFLQNSFNGTRFDFSDHIKHHLAQLCVCVCQKPFKFWEDRTFSLMTDCKRL